MSVIIKGGDSGYLAGVDANKNLQVITPTAMTQAGFAVLAGRNDDGTIVSGGRTNRIYVTEGNKIAVAPANVFWDDTFNATTQNTAKYKEPVATQTVTHVGGFAILNGTSITTINTNSAIQTYRNFPLFGKAELRLNVSGMITVAPQANAVTEFGLFNAVLPGAATPTDGVFFRWNASGQLKGVISYSGTETMTGVITSPSININHDFAIVCQTNTVLFYIDDILQGKISLLTDAPTQGQPMMAASIPFTARYYIGGSAPSLASQFKISDVFITMLGPDLKSPWSDIKAGFGHMGYQGQNGGTMGSTALYTNSLAAGAGAAMTNTTAALGSGLGGQFAALPTLTVGTDGIVCSFQNPVGTTNQTGRNLIITGVKTQGAVTTILNGGPVLYSYSLAFGHTAVSMATTETATTKAPRRIPLGYENFIVTAPVGTIGVGPFIQFRSPIVVAPGEFIAICAKNLGVVTTTGVITFQVMFDSYFE